MRHACIAAQLLWQAQAALGALATVVSGLT
jgi:hypothetical protein